MARNENQDKVDIKQYQDLDGLSTQKLNLGLWLVTNRKNLVVATIVILILLSASFFFYSGYHYTSYLLTGRDEDQKILWELSQYEPMSEEYRLKNSARDLEFFNIESFKIGDRYDLTTKIVNPNDRYYASFYYCFVEDDIELVCDSSFIFPLESKQLIELAVENTHRPLARLRIKSISWRRVNPHEYPDWGAFYNDRLNFETINIRFKPARKSALSENLSLDVLEFEIKNNTAFNYREVPLDIVLFNGTQVVGVVQHVLDNFYSGQQRSVRLVWTGNVTSATEVQITPSLNIVDNEIYLKY